MRAKVFKVEAGIRAMFPAIYPSVVSSHAEKKKGMRMREDRSGDIQ